MPPSQGGQISYGIAGENNYGGTFTSLAPYLTDAHHRKGDGWETVQGWYRLRLDEYPLGEAAVLNLTKACTQYYADSSGTLIWRKPASKQHRSAPIFRGLAEAYLSSGFNGMNDFEISQHLLGSNPGRRRVVINRHQPLARIRSRFRAVATAGRGTRTRGVDFRIESSMQEKI